jgi:hypothetical protein
MHRRRLLRDGRPGVRSRFHSPGPHGHGVMEGDAAAAAVHGGEIERARRKSAPSRPRPRPRWMRSARTMTKARCTSRRGAGQVDALITPEETRDTLAFLLRVTANNAGPHLGPSFSRLYDGRADGRRAEPQQRSCCLVRLARALLPVPPVSRLPVRSRRGGYRPPHRRRQRPRPSDGCPSPPRMSPPSPAPIRTTTVGASSSRFSTPGSTAVLGPDRTLDIRDFSGEGRIGFPRRGSMMTRSG